MIILENIKVHKDHKYVKLSVWLNTAHLLTKKNLLMETFVFAALKMEYL